MARGLRGTFLTLFFKNGFQSVVYDLSELVPIQELKLGDQIKEGSRLQIGREHIELNFLRGRVLP